MSFYVTRVCWKRGETKALTRCKEDIEKDLRANDQQMQDIANSIRELEEQLSRLGDREQALIEEMDALDE